MKKTACLITLLSLFSFAASAGQNMSVFKNDKKTIRISFEDDYYMYTFGPKAPSSKCEFQCLDREPVLRLTFQDESGTFAFTGDGNYERDPSPAAQKIRAAFRKFELNSNSVPGRIEVMSAIESLSQNELREAMEHLPDQMDKIIKCVAAASRVRVHSKLDSSPIYFALDFNTKTISDICATTPCPALAPPPLPPATVFPTSVR
jgi:hypothetical protein